LRSINSPPSEEISGTITAKWTKNWSTSFSAYHDIDRDVTRRQSFAVAYRDDCTLIEIAYTKSNFDNDIIRDSSGIGIRLALLTLGDFGD
jgi:LPS-assembly protein